ncbi:MAG: glycosyltransferase [Anaerolineae bacterium]|nr:glycosyltransferase [Anaerolineae bacterium]
MRIGMITGEYPPMQGGVGAFTRILAGELAAQGHELCVLSRAETRSDDPRVKLSASIENWGAGSVFAARRWARERDLDVVNVQYQTAAFGMSPFIHFLPDALRPIPVVTTFHDLRYPYLFPKAGSLRDWIVMRLARASAGVIATNHEDAARLAGLRSVLIPIGSNITVHPSDRDTWRARAGAAESDFLIVYFGLVNRSKGLDTLLEAAAQLRDLPIRLVLVGAVAGSSDPTNAAYMSEIDALIASLHPEGIDRLDLTPIIQRTGYLDDAAVSGYLTAADAIALPFRDGASYRRGTLMAALQHGGAVVTTQPAVPIPAFVDGENLRLVPPDDPTALAEALRRLYESPDERARLRAGAAALAHAFDWTAIAQATAGFFTDITGAIA